jgi:NAD+ diphosphatase
MLKNLFYSGGTLDRAAEFRRDPEWLEERRHDSTSRVVPLWRDKNLFRGQDEPAPVFLSGDEARPLLEMAGEQAFLGLDGDVAYFAADLSAHEAPPEIPGASFLDLRQAGPLLDQAVGSLLAFARGILYWHRGSGFCGTCGAPTESIAGGHIRKCTGAACGREHFPRTDAAVIMLVLRPGPDGGSALLSHQSKWIPGMWSVLAGFLEPGESLEEAVVREVREEAGIAVTDVRYRGSQPWPFPASLMVGFRATATTFDVSVDCNELDDCRWYTRAEVRDFKDNPRLPRPDSIARRLIAEWLAEE